jgi:hypothetical protein
MSKARKDAAFTVAEQLFATETAIDTALTTAAQFVGTMPVARQQARLSAIVGQEAMDHGMAAMAALNDARRAIVAAHRALSTVQGQIGLGALAFGGLAEKPPYPEKFALRAVEPVAA